MARTMIMAEQILLPLSAADACERPAGGVLAVGEGGGEAVGGVGAANDCFVVETNVC